MTNKTVVLSDLRAEIGPFKTIDLERVAGYDKVGRSYDLRHALDTGKISLIKHSVIHAPRSVSMISSNISKEDIETIVRKVVAESSVSTHTIVHEKVDNVSEESVSKAIKQGMSELLSSIKSELSSLSQEVKTSEDIGIDPEKFANIQSGAVKKEFDQIDAKLKQSRKITLKNKNLGDLATEL